MAKYRTPLYSQGWHPELGSPEEPEAEERKRRAPRNAAGIMKKRGLYDPRFEHDSCGVGFVAQLKKGPDHAVIESAVRILINLEHRGAVGADKTTGDGAGLLIELPHEFFRRECRSEGIALPEYRQYGVGMLFLPSDQKLRERCMKAVERIAGDEGCEVLGWRSVPLNPGELGHLSRSTMPDIRQVFLRPVDDIEPEPMERKFYVIRRLAEKEVRGWSDEDSSQFYVVSLSSRTIVYKGAADRHADSCLFPRPDRRTFFQPFRGGAPALQHEHPAHLESGPAVPHAGP